MKHCIEITLRVSTSWKMTDEGSKHLGNVICSRMEPDLKEADTLRHLVSEVIGKPLEGGHEPSKIWVARVDRLTPQPIPQALHE